MNIDKPGEEHIIDDDFHGEFDENLFQDLVADDILDPDLTINNQNMEGGRQGASQQGPQKWWLLTPLETDQSSLMRELNQQTIILMCLMIIWKYSKLMLLMPKWHKS